MKLNKLLLPLALALAATLATTGCKHGFNGKVTQLPGHRQETPGETGPGPTIPPGPAIDTTQGMANGNNNGNNGNGTGQNVQPGGGPTSDTWDPSMMTQDREKLAAYTVHFKFDSAVVQDSEQASIASVAQSLASDQNAKLLIEGNCDERGTEEYNRSLGERRALALRESLAKDGVDANRVRTISYGKDKPVDPDHNEAAWAKNRRGDFVYCTPKTPVQ